MPFLGILFDTVLLTLSVPEDRLREIEKLLAICMSRTKASKKNLQSLIGKLCYVAACVGPGRVFLLRLLRFLRGAKPFGNVVSDETKRDIMWWQEFLRVFNGTAMMALNDWSQEDELLACDACLQGNGGWSQGEFFHKPFPDFIRGRFLHIKRAGNVMHYGCSKGLEAQNAW